MRDSGKAVRVGNVLWIYMNVTLVRILVAGTDRSVDVPNGDFPVFRAGGAWDHLFLDYSSSFCSIINYDKVS